MVIIDTAGRLHTKSNLMDELSKISRVVRKMDPQAPHEVMLVVDAGTGQNALNQALEFHQAVGLTGIILTKLDGTAKGGIIFAIADRLGVRCCDREILEGVASRAHVDVELVNTLDEHVKGIEGNWWQSLFKGERLSREQYYHHLVKVVLSISRNGGVIVGRGAHLILGPVADANIEVDMIVQNISPHGKTTDFTFTVHRNDYQRALEILQRVATDMGAREVSGDARIVKISLVGVGMRSHAGIASTMFEALAKEGINIRMISTSEIKISVVVDEKYLELGVRALHEAFHLDQAASA